MTDTSNLRSTASRAPSTAPRGSHGHQQPTNGQQNAAAPGCECACGHLAASADELAEHLGEMFIPADDVASDGQRHAELFRPDADGTLWVCTCGFTSVEMRAFDTHLLAIFIPADAIGADGRRHGMSVLPSEQES
jgi:hypothetical protein